MFSKKIESLGRLYCGSSKYFPLEFLVRQLELLSCREEGDPAWVPVCLQVSQRSLLYMYCSQAQMQIQYRNRYVLTNDHVLFIMFGASLILGLV